MAGKTQKHTKIFGESLNANAVVHAKGKGGQDGPFFQPRHPSTRT